MRSCGFHLRTISQQVSKLLFCIFSLDITLLKSRPHLSGANEFIVPSDWAFNCIPAEWQIRIHCSKHGCCQSHLWRNLLNTGISLGMHPANERYRYIITTYLIALGIPRLIPVIFIGSMSSTFSNKKMCIKQPIWLWDGLHPDTTASNLHKRLLPAMMNWIIYC